MNNHLLAGVLLTGSLLGSPLAAQTPTVTAVPTAYKIAPDDVLSVNVVNFAMFSAPQVTVAPDGTISVPLLPAPVTVAGYTSTEVAQDLTRRLNKYVVNPSVSVSLVTRHKEFIYVSGYVARPESVELTPALHVLDALAEAGDALPTGDTSQATLTHTNGTIQTLDLSPAARRSGTATNPLLQPGDTISVPEQRAEFSVIGQVGKPGSYNYRTDMTVLDALTAAGNVTPDVADLRDATLTHDGKTTPLDLDAMLHHGDMSSNIKLSAGDQINVPKAPRTYVFGAVVNAGFYSFAPGDHVADALTASKVTPYADYKKVNIVHPNATGTVAKVQTINMEDFFKRGDPNANPPLQPGDAVYIESKGEPKRPWYDALAPVGIVAQAAHFLF